MNMSVCRLCAYDAGSKHELAEQAQVDVSPVAVTLLPSHKHVHRSERAGKKQDASKRLTRYNARRLLDCGYNGTRKPGKGNYGP